MAIIKVGVYSKWTGKIPKDKKGRPFPRSAWPKKRKRKWIVRWYCTDSKIRFGKVFKTRRQAEQYASELQRQVLLGRGDKLTEITLHDFACEHSQVMKGQIAIATLHEHMRALTIFEKWIGSSTKLSQITGRDAEAFIAFRQQDRSIETANKDIRTLRSIFNRAIEPRGYLKEGQNPFLKVKERKTTDKDIRYVSVEEYHKLIAAANRLWWKAVLSIAYGSGLRHNEILHLTWADIDFEQQRILIRAKDDTHKILKWDPKSRKKRDVAMSDQSSTLLADLQSQAPENHPYVFIDPDRLQRVLSKRKRGQWHERKSVINNITRDFHVIRRRAGVEHCVLHDLRRSAITRWADKLPIQVVQYLAGHSNIVTTRKYYLAIRNEDLQAATDWTNQVLAMPMPSDTNLTP